MKSKAKELDYARAAADVLGEIGKARIWIRSAATRFFASMLAEGTPVLTKDFSQSCEEGPRIFPSINAKPGHRVQLLTCEQDGQVVRSFSRIERTSFIFSECLQISRNFCFRTLGSLAQPAANTPTNSDRLNNSVTVKLRFMGLSPRAGFPTYHLLKGLGAILRPEGQPRKGQFPHSL